MKQKDLDPYFLMWCQKRYPNGRIYRNNSGCSWNINSAGKKYPIFFGIPLPKGKGQGGGGPDWFLFLPRLYGVEVICYEVKTKNDTLSKNQINFGITQTFMKGKYFVVHENHKKLKTFGGNIVEENEIFIIEEMNHEIFSKLKKD